MELNRISLPPLTTPGDVITCYAYEGGATRSTVVAALAHALAGRAQAGTPVLMIDWDTEAPGLDRLFEAPAGLQGGILELFAAYREALARPGPDPAGRARQALEAVPWQDYLVRVDQTRPLYLLRAGRLDASFGERAAAFSWSALFGLCPPLFRQFAAMLAAHFRYVLIDARGGRSEQVSICTTFLPDKLVAMFPPCQRSLDGTVGVVQRALDYRRSHEEEQRPLVVYPLPLGVDAEHAARRARWRWGEPDQPGYQRVFEHLLGDAYGYEQLSLAGYFDEVQLPHAAAFPEGPGPADRLSARRGCETLLDWLADGYFPWQSRRELRLLRRLAAARLDDGDRAAQARLLYRLGCCHADEQRPRQACDALDQAIALFQRTVGEDHPATRQARERLAGLMLDLGKLAEARFLYELLLEDSAAPALRLGLARTLSCQGEHEDALALLAELVAEEGDGQPHFTAQLALADALARQGELTRARMLYERVLEGRQRLLGEAHEESLVCMRQLAALLCRLGDLFNARRLQESLLALRLRHDGAGSAAAARERELLAEILA
ncbi:MAG TPA: tetratricopeptide repeat protein, partial [Telluria sp.]|nr:tetratricopeptide repeat protein [Telluria sp.]